MKTADISKVQLNADFAEWTRSTRFHLSLCEWAIDEILSMQRDEESLKKGADNTGTKLNRESSADYLRRRGLIHRCRVPGCYANWVLTDAGRAVATLLGEAGFYLQD